ncbi:MAG TPA: DUF1634 domain-containing protein [Caldilineae bacterium]|nr:DUF1634 domain-containing protein [Caldilineae bacterium]
MRRQIDYARLIPGIDVAEISEEDEAALRTIASTRQIDRIVQRLLMVTLVVSAILFIAGAIWQVVAHLPPVHHVTQIADLTHTNGPDLLFSLGLIVLIVSPILRLIGVAVGLAQQGDWAFVGVTALVLAVMLASLWIG